MLLSPVHLHRTAFGAVQVSRPQVFGVNFLFTDSGGFDMPLEVRSGLLNHQRLLYLLPA